jgi:periplasmic divalent cation tolerance protein
MNEYQQVTITTPDIDTAMHICRTLVGEKLVACGQVMTSPVKSVYHWQGSVEEAHEHICFFKIMSADFVTLEKRILELHPYDVPEIVAVDLKNGHKAYLDWISSSTKR